MFGHSYYFGTTRKYISLFGTLFNDILIDRIDQATGNVLKRILVPLAYGPKDRYLARIQQNPDLLREINQVLPRMTFEIKSIEYDASRKLNTIGRNRYIANTVNSNSLNIQYNPVPYNYNIDLSVLAKNADDATRIVEQILPFFKPEWTTTINLIPEMGITMDIPIVLKNIQYEDTYEANFTDRYAIIWTLQFVLKGYLYGPVSASGVIQQANVNLYNTTSIDNTAAEGVSVTPGLTATGLPTSNAALSVPVANIAANSNYGFITDFYNNIT